MLVEAKAVEVAMTMAKECIEEQSIIEFEWKMQVGDDISSTPTSWEHFAIRISSQQRVKGYASL